MQSVKAKPTVVALPQRRVAGSVFPWPTDQASLSPASEAGRDTRLKPTVQVPLSKPCPSGRSGPYSPRPAIQASLSSASGVGRAVRLTLLGPASVKGRDTYPKPTVQVSLSKPCLSGGPSPYSPRPCNSLKPPLALPQWWAEPFVLPRVALPEWRAEPFLKGPQVKAVAGSAIRLRPTVKDEPFS